MTAGQRHESKAFEPVMFRARRPRLSVTLRRFKRTVHRWSSVIDPLLVVEIIGLASKQRRRVVLEQIRRFIVADMLGVAVVPRLFMPI